MSSHRVLAVSPVLGPRCVAVIAQRCCCSCVYEVVGRACRRATEAAAPPSARAPPPPDSNGVDLEGFPLVRLDQLGLLPDYWLHRCAVELSELMAVLRSGGGGGGGLLPYAAHLAAGVEEERLRRAAAARVSALLVGDHGAATSVPPYVPLPAEREAPARRAPPPATAPAPAPAPRHAAAELAPTPRSVGSSAFDGLDAADDARSSVSGAALVARTRRPPRGSGSGSGAAGVVASGASSGGARAGAAAPGEPARVIQFVVSSSSGGPQGHRGKRKWGDAKA